MQHLFQEQQGDDKCALSGVWLIYKAVECCVVLCCDVKCRVAYCSEVFSAVQCLYCGAVQYVV